MDVRHRVSVIIPAYNAAATIGRCLEALADQTRAPEEIIVVDDGSTDDTASVARSAGITVVSQENAGPAAARNYGAEMARGSVLLFTDADCAPDRAWVERMIEPFEDPAVAGVKGTYRTRQPGLVPRFVQLEYESRYDHMEDREAIDFVDTYSAGYRRDVFVTYNGFDTRFPTASVEDQELSFRLAGAGHRLVFVPQAQVFHLHDETLWDYVRRKFWIGCWKVRVMRTHPAKVVRDSHTPQMLKVQMLLAGLGGLLVVAALLARPLAPQLTGRLAAAGVSAWVLLVLSAIPFLVKIWRRDRRVLLVAPLMVFLRAWALGLGFSLGAVRELLRR